MLLDKSVKPLVLEVKASRILFIIHLGLFVVSLSVIIFIINLHPVWKFILVTLLSAYVLYLQYKPVGGYLSGNALALTLYQNGDWLLECSGTKPTYTEKLRLQGGSRVSNFIIILHFTKENKRRMYLWLLRDSLKQNDYRKLRIRLNQARFAESEMFAE